MIKEYAQNLQMQGITLEQFYQFTNMTEDKLKDEYKEQATKRVTYRLILDAIIKEESIDATEEEVNKEIEDLSNKYKMSVEEFTNNFGTEMIKYELKVRKVFDLLKGNK